MTILVVEVSANNTSVERTITKVYQVAPFDVPDGITLDIITKAGQLIAGLSAGQVVAIAPPLSGSGQVLTYNPAVSGGMEWLASSDVELLYLTNKTGTDSVQGAVVKQKTSSASAFEEITGATDKVLGVLSGGVVNDGEGFVLQDGPATVLVQGNVAIGDYLVPSATQGRAAASTATISAFAIALTAYAGGGAGSVTAALLVGVVGPKRVTKRVQAVTFNTAPTYNTDNYDVFVMTCTDNVASFTTNLSGTPANDGDMILWKLQGASAYTLAWGASFRNGGTDLPTALTADKRLKVLLMWDATDSIWECVGVQEEG